MASKYVVLWHGTKRSSAVNIRRTGFHANSYFSESIDIARGRAKLKRGRRDPGVLLLLCAINLDSYEKHDYRKDGRVYNFMPPVSKNAVAGILKINEFTKSELREKADLLRTRVRLMGKPGLRDTKRRRPKRKVVRLRGPEIVITRNCGSDALVYWINTCLSTQIDKQIEAEHPGIE